MERPNNRKRVVATAVAGGLVAVTLAGCGGGGSDGGKKSAGGGGPDGVKQSTRAVQATHDKTTGAKTAKLTLATEVKGAGEQAAATGAGVVDLADGSSDVTLTSQGQELKQRTLDGMIYQQPPAGSGSGLPDGKSWMKIDLEKLAGQQGTGAGQVSDPAASFSYTKGISDKNVKKVGTATVDGAKTTHYRVTVDVDALAKDNTEQTRKLKEQLGATLPLDIWLDGDGRLRQQKMELTVKRPAGETEGPAQVAVLTTLKLSNFGTDVNVTAPAAKDTVDVTAKLAEQGSGSQAG